MPMHKTQTCTSRDGHLGTQKCSMTNGTGVCRQGAGRSSTLRRGPVGCGSQGRLTPPHLRGLLPFHRLSMEQHSGEGIFLAFPAPHLQDSDFLSLSKWWPVATITRGLSNAFAYSGFRTNQQAMRKMLQAAECVGLSGYEVHFEA